jgi:D-sedoheptulose 7-phosphate isomerase
MANDYGYTQVYLRSLQVLARPGDLLFAISSSGCSENILSSARFARDQGMKLVTLSGFAVGNPLWQLDADVALYLPSNWFGQVEIGHEALLHAIVESLWREEQIRET